MSLILNDIETHASALRRALYALEILADGNHEGPEPDTLSGLFAVLHLQAESLEACLVRCRTEQRQQQLAAQSC